MLVCPRARVPLLPLRSELPEERLFPLVLRSTSPPEVRDTLPLRRAVRRWVRRQLAELLLRRLVLRPAPLVLSLAARPLLAEVPVTPPAPLALDVPVRQRV